MIAFIFDQWWCLWEIQNQDRHGRNLATTQQAMARQVDQELTMFYDTYEDRTPQHLQWLFNTMIDVRRQWPPNTTRQWLNTWTPLLQEALNPEAAPTNPVNYPYSTVLETE